MADRRAADVRCCCMALSNHPASMTMHLAGGCFPLGRRPYGEHVVFDLDRAGLLEDQCCLEVVALVEWHLQIDEHDVDGAGVKLDRLAGPDFEAVRERSHLR